jgi:hypothetical protein
MPGKEFASLVEARAYTYGEAKGLRNALALLRAENSFVSPSEGCSRCTAYREGDRGGLVGMWSKEVGLGEAAPPVVPAPCERQQSWPPLPFPRGIGWGVGGQTSSFSELVRERSERTYIASGASHRARRPTILAGPYLPTPQGAS